MIFADSEQITTGGVATGQGGRYSLSSLLSPKFLTFPIHA